jgi:hypothetical protein
VEGGLWRRFLLISHQVATKQAGKLEGEALTENLSVHMHTSSSAVSCFLSVLCITEYNYLRLQLLLSERCVAQLDGLVVLPKCCGCCLCYVRLVLHA